MIALTSSADEDPDFRVAKTKRQIHALVQEIVQLADSTVPVPEFFAGFLSRVVAALAAPGGAIWRLDRGGNLQVVYDDRLRATGLLDDPNRLAAHVRLLREVMHSTAGVTISPGEGWGPSNLVNATERLLVLAPLGFDGIVEVFQRPILKVQTRRGYLRFLRQMCELADAFLSKHPR